MQVPMSLVLEGLVVVLLGITVAYCFVLDRRLRALRSGQDGMKDLIKGLNDATDRAQSGVAQLKVSGDAVGKELKDVVTHARTLADELALMIESGNNIADRLEGSASQATQHQNDALIQLAKTAEEDALPLQEQFYEVDESLLRALRQAR